MRRRGPFGVIQPAILAVVIVQAADLQPGISDLPYELDNLVFVALLDSCAIHAGINVEKDTNPAAMPLPHLSFVLGEDGDADVWEVIRYFAHATCVCSDNWIGE